MLEVSYRDGQISVIESIKVITVLKQDTSSVR